MGQQNQYYNKMSVTKQQNLNIDIKNFIDLLQNNEQLSPRQRKLSLDSDKLSIIYSASEPQSSMPDKESKHQSKSNEENNQVINEVLNEVQQLFREIKTMRLSLEQARVVDKIQKYIMELKNILINKQYQIAQISAQLNEANCNTQDILTTIIQMDQDHKQLWDNYQALEDKHLRMQKYTHFIKQQCEELKRKLAENEKDMQFMKTLVLVANQNYEKMEKECKHLSTQNKILDSFREQRNSPVLSSRSTIYNKKCSFSPSISEKSNVSAKKADSDENYRRLVLRTLKNKAIR